MFSRRMLPGILKSTAGASEMTEVGVEGWSG